MYIDNIGVASKLYVAHTHTRTVTELFTYEVLLYSSCYKRLPAYSSPSAPPTIQQTGWSVQVSSGVAFCLRMIRTGSRFSLICAHNNATSCSRLH